MNTSNTRARGSRKALLRNTRAYAREAGVGGRFEPDLTLWGLWLASGCGKGLPLIARCDAYEARPQSSAHLNLHEGNTP